MKRAKRFLSAALAAAVFGSMSAYVVTAAGGDSFGDVKYESVTTAYPNTFTGEKLTAAEKIGDYSAAINEDNEVVVTFEKTYAEISKVMEEDELLNKSASDGGVDPVYLNIETNLDASLVADTNFNWVTDGGYDWNSATHSDNFDSGHIMLWLDPSAENDPKTIKYTVDSGKEQTLKINYKYASTTRDYLTLIMASGSANIEFVDGMVIARYPNVHNNTRFAIPVGATATITINSPGKTIESVKIGSSTTKRDAAKVADGEYSFTVAEGDTEIEVKIRR